MLDKIKMIPVASLRTAPWNYKKTEGPKVELMKSKLREALRKRGQIVTMAVRILDKEAGIYEVVDGNHRLEVFQERDVEQAACVDLGEISQAEAELISLELNELDFEPDNVRLGILFKHILSELPIADLSRTIPYEPVEIQNHIKALDFDWKNFQSQQPPPDDSPTVQGGKNVKIELNVSRELAEEFKNQIKRFRTHEAAIRFCTVHVASCPDEMLTEGDTGQGA